MVVVCAWLTRVVSSMNRNCEYLCTQPSGAVHKGAQYPVIMVKRKYQIIHLSLSRQCNDPKDLKYLPRSICCQIYPRLSERQI